MRAHAKAAIALLCFVVLFFGANRAASQSVEPQPEPTQEATTPAPAEQPVEQPEPLAACSDCHDTAKAFAHNAHALGGGTKGQIPNDSCGICHGDGTAHIEAGGDKTLIEVPRDLKGAEETCRSCHDVTTGRMSHAAGVHANSNVVNCLSCHAIHKSDPRSPRLLVEREPALCANCHSTQASTMRHKPYSHRVGRGMECSSCHQPHGRSGRGNLRLTEAGEPPCLGCHTDKRGPFVFQHGAVAAGECTTCHEPHGSSNPKMLTRATVAQLCLECHSPTTGGTLGSQPPSFHNLTNPRYQNCTTCHVAIHGSHRDPALLK